MGKKHRKDRHKSGSYKRKSGIKEINKSGSQKPRRIVFGLSQLDNTQGQDYQDWEDYKILSKALDRLQGLCAMSVEQAKAEQIIKQYTEELPKGSKFKRPKHIDEDITWCSIRVQGKVRIIGHIEDNYIFQVVFLDKEHEFYPSKKKNT